MKVFIDGKEGTTGLKIFERFEKRDDIELLSLPEEKRKDSSPCWPKPPSGCCRCS